MNLINIFTFAILILLFFRYTYKIKENFECKTIVNYKNKMSSTI